uniref:Uncharacterized protein n=2 Tax=Chenopodium quinoa TaxID=63459 RepID=A0A803MWM8_CHEQI
MVKRDPYYYHLPDLLPLKHVFQGFQDSWLLHVNVTRLKISPDFNNNAKFCQNLSEINSNKQNQGSKATLQGAAPISTAYPSRKKKRRKRKPNVKTFPKRFSHERLDQEAKGNISSEVERKRSGLQQVLHQSNASDFNATAESPHGSLSEAVSVSGIIDKYFINFIDIDHNGSSSSSVVATRTGKCDTEKISFGKKCSNKRNSVIKCQRFLPSLLPEDSNSASLKSNYERSEVGKRLVVASNNLGSFQRFSLSKAKKFWNSDDGSIIRSLIFEMNTND